MNPDDIPSRLRIPISVEPDGRPPRVNAPDWHEVFGMPVGYDKAIVGASESLPDETPAGLVAGAWRPVNAIGVLVPVGIGVDGRPQFGLDVSWAWTRPLYLAPKPTPLGQSPSSSVQ